MPDFLSECTFATYAMIPMFGLFKFLDNCQFWTDKNKIIKANTLLDLEKNGQENVHFSVWTSTRRNHPKSDKKLGI